VTVNVQLLVLVDASVTLQLTVVVPFGKVAPEAGVQVGVPTPAQLSLTVGFANVTTAEHTPAAVGTVTFAGHVIVGACVSFIVTVKVQFAVRPIVSVAVQVTVVVPLTNVDPEAGAQTVVAPEQLSVGVGVVKVTTAVHTLASVDWVMFPGQAIAGG